MKQYLPLLLLPLISLAACCQVKDPYAGLTLPPPLSKHQQIDLLNARAAAVQTLKARGTISVTFVDDKGSHSNSADAVILLQQRPKQHEFDPAVDVLLLGKVAGSAVFEMGVNAQFHWLAFKVDPNTAYIGRMDTRPANSPTDRAPLRADRVLTVLALSQIGESDTTRIAMTSNGEAGGPHNNELHIIRFLAPFGAYIERTLVIDRHTGNVTYIRTYFPDGRVESVAHLTDFRAGTNKDGSTTPFQFPSHILIDTSDQSHIDLTMDSYDINPTIPPQAFATPNFEKQGLKVLPAN